MRDHGRGGDVLPREPLRHLGARGSPEASPQRCVAEQFRDRAAQGLRVFQLHQQSSSAVRDGSLSPPTAAATTALPCAISAHHAEAFAPRGRQTATAARVSLRELVRRRKPSAWGTSVTAGRPRRRRGSGLRTLRRAPRCPSRATGSPRRHLRRLLAVHGVYRNGDPVQDHADVARAARAGCVGEQERHRDHDPHSADGAPTSQAFRASSRSTTTNPSRAA